MVEMKDTSGVKSHFRRVVQFDTDYCPSTITKYESEATGLSAVVVDRKGPKVLGYFALATEIFDDSGAPHTLEHLVFMGSRNYPYKGLLDKLANRAYSNTNAWTATDHTAYTLDTAGWEGFAQILPVYLEHVILPTLTDSGCYTEVHHINGSGQDAGVVYSEMQAVQNQSSSIMNLHANRHLYPEGVGFRYETGGMMEALRVLTTKRIRDFHKEMYKLKNMCVVIIGEVNHEDLLRILDEFDNTILKEVPSDDHFKRPWVESKQPPPLEKSVLEVVEFPEKDESMGEISVAFFGPHCSDPVAMAAITTIETYLAGSSVSVFEKNLVEIKDPYASQVSMYSEERPNTVLWIELSSVPTKRLEEAEKKLFEVLNETTSKPLDFPYIQDCLRRSKRQAKFYLDKSGDYLSNPVINDFLFGKRDGSTLMNLETLNAYDKLEEWKEEDWRGFMKRWISHAPHVSILGRPSAELAKKIKEDDKARVDERVKKLGEEGLKKLEQQLKDAIAKNDTEIPKEVLEKFKVPGVDSIHFIDTLTARGGLARAEGVTDNMAQKLLDSDSSTKEIPLYLHFEHVRSNFVSVNIILSTEEIHIEDRPLLTIYLDNFFNTPIMKDGVRIEYEDVVTRLEKDTVEYRIEGAGRLGTNESIRVKFEIEPEKYQATVDWLSSLFWDSIFDKERLSVATSKLLQDIPDEKRSGDDMAYSVSKMITYSQESLGRARDTLVKGLYLKRISHLLKNGGEKYVIARMEELRNSLCKIDNMRVLVVADIEKLKGPVSSWDMFATRGPKFEKLAPIARTSDRLAPIGKMPGDVAHVVPLHAIDSSFSVHTGVGLDSRSHPKLPALELVLSYLQTVEGPLWCGVRGTGLAYGVNFTTSVDSGHILYNIYRSPNAYNAFVASRKVITDLIDGTTAFDPILLEGAVSSIVVSFADSEPNMGAAGIRSFINQVIHGQSKDYNMQLLKKIKQVTTEEMRGVLKDIVLPVFEPGKSIVVVTSSPVKVKEIKEAFAKDGFTSVVVTGLNKFQDDYGLKVPGMVDDDDTDESESDDDDDDSDYNEDEDESDEE